MGRPRRVQDDPRRTMPPTRPPLPHQSDRPQSGARHIPRACRRSVRGACAIMTPTADATPTSVRLRVTSGVTYRPFAGTTSQGHHEGWSGQGGSGERLCSGL
jgi:hypothetical protein